MPGSRIRRPLGRTAAIALATVVISWTLAAIAVLPCETAGADSTAACALNYDDENAPLGLLVLLAPTLLATVASWTRPRRWALASTAGIALAAIEFVLLTQA